MRSLWLFLRLVYAEWSSLVTGSFSAILFLLGLGVAIASAMGANIPGSSIIQIGSWIFAAISGVRASYLVWEQENLARREAETALRKTKELNLEGRIEGSICGADANGMPMCSMTVTIRNLGPPTIADRWQARIHQGHKMVYGQIQAFAPDAKITLHSDSWDPITLEQDDFIYEKTLKPIPTGGQERGWLVTKVPETTIKELREGNFVIEVIFHDVRDNEYSCEHKIKKTAEGEMPLYYPGSGGTFGANQQTMKNK